MRYNTLRFLPAVSVGILFAVACPHAPAGALARDQELGLAAARGDAFLNLSRQLYAISVSARSTVGDLLAADDSLRDSVEAAMRGAYVIGEPRFGESGIVRVTAEFLSGSLPYALRSQIRDLPRTFWADGVADKAAALAASEAIGEDAALTNEVKEWAAKNLEADGQAVVGSAEMSDEAKLAAKREALTNSYTELFKAAMKLGLDRDVTVADFLAHHPELRGPLNATLVGAQLVAEDLRGRSYKAKVSVPGALLIAALRIGPHRTLRGRTLSAGQVELARRNARADAVENLQARIASLTIRSGATVGEFIAKKQDIQDHIARLCRLAPIEQIEITREGLLKMYVTIPTRDLHRDLQPLLATSSPQQVSVVGAGLPVVLQPKK